MLAIIAFIVILGLLVFVHEAGHFLAAKKAGMAVEEFGFGFPPRIFGIRRGETLYSLNWIPLGGFVKIKGISDDETDDARMGDEDSFATKSIWRRMSVVAAGVVMNVLFAITLFAIGFGIGIPSVVEQLPASARVRDAKIQIVEVLPNSPAQQADVRLADQIVSINGTDIVNTKDVQEAVKEGENTVVLQRGNEVLNKSISSVRNEELARSILGVTLVKTGIVSYPWVEAIGQAFITGFSLLWQILLAFGTLLQSLIFDQKVPSDIAGPVGVAVITGQVAEQGFIYLLQFTALLSLNLAIINFLPIPALDGGRFLFLLIEKLRRKPMDQKVEGRAHKIGFALLLLLVLLVTFRDVAQFKDPIVNFFSNLF